MEETIQKNLDQNREMIERIPLEDKRDWKEEFVKWFYKEPAMELANGVGTPENIADWWVGKLEEQKKELLDLIKYELVLLRKQDGERYVQDKNLVYSRGVGETLSKVSEVLESLNHHE